MQLKFVSLFYYIIDFLILAEYFRRNLIFYLKGAGSLEEILSLIPEYLFLSECSDKTVSINVYKHNKTINL